MKRVLGMALAAVVLLSDVAGAQDDDQAVVGTAMALPEVHALTGQPTLATGESPDADFDVTVYLPPIGHPAIPMRASDNTQ